MKGCGQGRRGWAIKISIKQASVAKPAAEANLGCVRIALRLLSQPRFFLNEPPSLFVVGPSFHFNSTMYANIILLILAMIAIMYTKPCIFIVIAMISYKLRHSYCSKQLLLFQVVFQFLPYCGQIIGCFSKNTVLSVSPYYWAAKDYAVCYK